MDNLSLSEILIHSTIYMETFDKNGKGAGDATSFLFNLHINDVYDQVPILVTNRHVLQDVASVVLPLSVRKAGTKDNYTVYNHLITHIEDIVTFHPNPNTDLAILPFGHVFQQIQDKGFECLHKTIPDEIIPTDDQWMSFDVIEEVTMIGYPNRVRDKVNNLPIVRRGITATPLKYDFDGKKIFLLDIACFPGSSGSPILILNEGFFPSKGSLRVGTRLFLLGIQSSGSVLPKIEKVISSDGRPLEEPLNKLVTVNQSFVGLAIVAKSTELLAFKDLVLQRIAHQDQP